MKSKFKIGNKVKHKLTTTKGKITAIAFYDNGIISYRVQPKKRKVDWYTENHLRLIK